MFNLSLKIFRWLPLVNSVLKFQIKLGTLKHQSISLFWPFSIYTWNLAPENACGAEHFSHCVFLGQAKPRIRHSENAQLFSVILHKFSLNLQSHLCTLSSFFGDEQLVKKLSKHGNYCKNCTLIILLFLRLQYTLILPFLRLFHNYSKNCVQHSNLFFNIIIIRRRHFFHWAIM